MNFTIFRVSPLNSFLLVSCPSSHQILATPLLITQTNAYEPGDGWESGKAVIFRTNARLFRQRSQQPKMNDEKKSFHPARWSVRSLFFTNKKFVWGQSGKTVLNETLYCLQCKVNSFSSLKACCTCKIACVSFKAIHSHTPQYLHDLLHWYTAVCTLRSANKNLLAVPSSRTILADSGGQISIAIRFKSRFDGY